MKKLPKDSSLLRVTDLTLGAVSPSQSGDRETLAPRMASTYIGEITTASQELVVTAKVLTSRKSKEVQDKLTENLMQVGELFTETGFDAGKDAEDSRAAQRFVQGVKAFSGKWEGSGEDRRRVQFPIGTPVNTTEVVRILDHINNRYGKKNQREFLKGHSSVFSDLALSGKAQFKGTVWEMKSGKVPASEVADAILATLTVKRLKDGTVVTPKTYSVYKAEKSVSSETPVKYRKIQRVVIKPTPIDSRRNKSWADFQSESYTASVLLKSEGVNILSLSCKNDELRIQVKEKTYIRSISVILELPKVSKDRIVKTNEGYTLFPLTITSSRIDEIHRLWRTWDCEHPQETTSNEEKWEFLSHLQKDISNITSEDGTISFMSFKDVMERVLEDEAVACFFDQSHTSVLTDMQIAARFKKAVAAGVSRYCRTIKNLAEAWFYKGEGKYFLTPRFENNLEIHRLILPAIWPIHRKMGFDPRHTQKGVNVSPGLVAGVLRDREGNLSPTGVHWEYSSLVPTAVLENTNRGYPFARSIQSLLRFTKPEGFLPVTSSIPLPGEVRELLQPMFMILIDSLFNSYWEEDESGKMNQVRFDLVSIFKNGVSKLDAVLEKSEVVSLSHFGEMRDTYASFGATLALQGGRSWVITPSPVEGEDDAFDGILTQLPLSGLDGKGRMLSEGILTVRYQLEVGAKQAKLLFLTSMLKGIAAIVPDEYQLYAGIHRGIVAADGNVAEGSGLCKRTLSGILTEMLASWVGIIQSLEAGVPTPCEIDAYLPASHFVCEGRAAAYDSSWSKARKGDLTLLTPAEDPEWDDQISKWLTKVEDNLGLPGGRAPIYIGCEADEEGAVLLNCYSWDGMVQENEDGSLKSLWVKQIGEAPCGVLQVARTSHTEETMTGIYPKAGKSVGVSMRSMMETIFGDIASISDRITEDRKETVAKSYEALSILMAAASDYGKKKGEYEEVGE